MRDLRGVSQENMADMLGMSVLAYGEIERGKTDIKLSRLEQIAEKLGTSAAKILNFDEAVSNFFDQCSTPQVVTGTNNGGQTANNYDNKELQHQLDKAKLLSEKKDV